jgi:multidrug resistance efflux pump
MRSMQPRGSSIGKGRKRVYVATILAFLGYTAWMVGPYLRSVIVRDAAVTSWTNVATSPIAGVVVATPLAVTEVIGADGVILTIGNELATRKPVNEAKIRAELARTRVVELEEFIEEIRLLDEGRRDIKARYADTFRAQVDVEIAGLERRIGVTSDRLETMRKVAARSEDLAVRGVGAESAADEARMRVANLEQEIAELKAALAYARVRRQAANDSVFITMEGEDPAWVLGERVELKLAKTQARLELREALSELGLALAALKTAEQEFIGLSEATVRAPPGSVLWSRRVAPGATVMAGETVAEWLDCANLMVDVPVSDAEVALIRPGMAAEVILEGESRTRAGEVLLTRGSASTLNRDDLAAIAKGRTEGVAQALLELDADPAEFEHCPVGRAAYLDFPDVGLLDVLRARVRL